MLSVLNKNSIAKGMATCGDDKNVFVTKKSIKKKQQQ